MPLPSTLTPIATNTLTAAAASVTFSNLPQTYTDLVLVVNPLSAIADNVALQFNGDTGTNYSTSILWGNGSAAGSTRQSNTANPYMSYYASTNTTQSNVIIQIMNYTNSTTNKTSLSRANNVATGCGTDAITMLWRNTAAITSIVVKQVGGNNFSTGSTFNLYGVKAA